MEMMVCSGVNCELKNACKRFDPINAAFNTKPQFSRPPFISIVIAKVEHVECDKFIDGNNTYYHLMERMKDNGKDTVDVR